ncbi:MAG: outer membrane protein transport protein [Rhodanobacteraceae bacterium]|nr:outer membrane protein transport protein [Rhodanobacteraceae bacterium]MBP9154546.1 outer membrane protein transport protein [Xanthomonadales bacterium]HQW80287.1 outer membrane protein transport protein [Pseudomonadota bacterium]
MKKLLPLAIGAALLAAASSAFAITDEEGNASLQFNFSAPGARSLAMGGAFIGLADDATAAFSNPAGLTQLASKEVSFEQRINDFSTEYVRTGSYTPDPFNINGLSYDEARSQTHAPSFISFVWPHENWAVAVYRHEFLNYETGFTSTGVDSGLANGAGDIFPFTAAIDVRISNFGLSGAFKATDKLSLGISLNNFNLDLDSNTRRFTMLGDTVTRFSTQQYGNDGAFGFSLGGQYRINDQWQTGLVYRHAPEFKYTASIIPGSQNFTRIDKSAYFDTPDLFGIGVVYRPTEAWTVALDVSHVMYSDLTNNMQSNFRIDDSDALSRSALDPLQIDDGVEVRLGMEYTFTEAKVPFSLRAGLWQDPEHTVRFQGTPSLDSGDAVANAVLFSTGNGNELHTSIGFGWAFEKVQIDAAFDASDRNQTISMSGVVRF